MLEDRFPMMNERGRVPEGMGADAPYDPACRFVVALGEAAHQYGSTAGRLEAFLARVTQALGFRGVFRSTPTEIVFAFQESEDTWQRVHVAPRPGTGLDLAKLAQVGDLVDELEAGDLPVEEGHRRLAQIAKTPHPWGTVASAASYAFAGAGFAILLTGSWWDVLFATILSLVVFAMVLASGRRGTVAAIWLPFSTAFVAGALTAGAKLLVPELNWVLVTLCAILILIPGYSVSVGVIELLTGHVVSGAANLMSGLVYLAKQFVGAWLGVGLVGLLVAMPASGTASPVDTVWLWAAIPLLILSLCFAFQTPPRDFLSAALVCAGAYGGIALGGALAGGNLGNLLGTIAAVVLANLWAGWTKRPTSIVLLPAIVLLVSGSIGFRGLASLAVGQTAVGEQQLLQMFVVALTIAAGLLVGNTIVRPKATL